MLNRSQQLRRLYAELRFSLGDISAGQLLRVAALILEASTEEEDADSAPKPTAYSYTRPVDLAISDGGWSILFNDRRSLAGIWGDEPDPADTTSTKLKNLIGKVEWPQISRMA